MSKSEIKNARPVLAESSFLTESGVKFLASYHFWIVAAVWLAARTYAIWGLNPDIFVEIHPDSFVTNRALPAEVMSRS